MQLIRKNAKTFQGIPLSILDLSPINTEETATDALNHSVTLAKDAEALGYNRYWVAEHHNTASSASAATAIVINQLANETTSIRLGSGGIMLPNHAPLVVAEQFGTLASLHSHRIDLGLGRAPGTDQVTARALHRGLATEFPQQVEELSSYFADKQINTQRKVRAFVAEGQDVPIWLLGSSTFSAQLAAEQGRPYAFAGHFSPGSIKEAITVYREHFKPSADLAEPYVMLALNVVVAKTDEQANWLFSSMQQLFFDLLHGKSGAVKPPTDMSTVWQPFEEAAVLRALEGSIVGSKATVADALKQRIEATGVDELMLTAHLYNHEDRRFSYQLLGELID